MRLQKSPAHWRQLATAPTTATSLVECAVRVSPNLARLIRKCAVTEATGASPRSALLASVGLQANEVDELRDRTKLLAQQLEAKQEILERHQRLLDAAEVLAAEGEKERIKLRQRLSKAAETEEKSRQTVAALRAQIANLQTAIAGLEDKLRRSISTEGLDERATFALEALKDRLSRGEDTKTATLAMAGYEALRIEDAIANHDRAEIIAFNTLLKRPSWRRSIVLRLLNAVSSGERNER